MSGFYPVTTNEDIRACATAAGVDFDTFMEVVEAVRDTLEDRIIGKHTLWIAERYVKEKSIWKIR